MKYKSLSGALIILASVVMLSSLQICSVLYSVATATIGFIGTSEPTTGIVLLYVLSGILLIGGTVLIILDLCSKEKTAK